jgi:hypothetical protein
MHFAVNVIFLYFRIITKVAFDSLWKGGVNKLFEM